jgi:hypothetical protein
LTVVGLSVSFTLSTLLGGLIRGHPPGFFSFHCGATLRIAAS